MRPVPELETAEDVVARTKLVALAQGITDEDTLQHVLRSARAEMRSEVEALLRHLTGLQRPGSRTH